MDWTLVALVATALFGVVTVFDKLLIDKHMPTLSCFNISVGIALLTHGLIFLVATGIPEAAPPTHLLMAGVSGLCWGGALAMMFWGYKLEEASRASAVIHTFPVFVALLAVASLGEVLIARQWIAIVVVVVGAFMISLRGSARGGLTRLSRAFPVLVGASMFTALAHLTGKYALEELPVWTVFWLRNLGMAAVFALFWRPSAFRQLLGAVRRRETLALLVLGEFILAPLAVWLNVAATSLGPVSLVATLTGSRPFFVFIFSTVLSTPHLRVLNEPLERNTLAVKLTSMIMIVGGISALTLL